MQAITALRQGHRKLPACDECKRRKVRCSGGDSCANCKRDGKSCAYSSPLIQLSATERRLGAAERRIWTIERAWAINLPHLNLEDAINNLESGQNGSPIPTDPEFHNDSNRQPQLSEAPVRPTDQPLEASPAEASNAEDFEFDESQDFDNTTDGMGFLVAEPGKAGYMGPQSGVAAVKFLQSLHLYAPFPSTNTTSLDASDTRNLPVASPTDIIRYMNDYFAIYHTAYPILHEGTFRARVSGALSKPRDGSWSLLYNIVLAIGAFVGETQETNSDIPFYRNARENLNMDILEKGSLSYVQGLVLMANYLQKRNKPNAGFVLIGIAFSMALAIGLHREFGLPHSSPFTMEIRRRVWWVLFIFVSGAQLTLGRPPVSLVGVNVRLPSTLDDGDLAVDMEKLPDPGEGPTVTTCLIHQVRLAVIANMVQVELLTNQIPTVEKALALDQKISEWRQDLPAHFSEDVILSAWFEVPKRILIWRSFHLRIILHRPIIFGKITEKQNLDQTIGSIQACLSGAEECVQSICDFVDLADSQPRGLAWYATYWLITASFVQATCYIYDPAHTLATQWRKLLKRSVLCLERLGMSHSMAWRARDILKKLLDQSESSSFLVSTPTSMSNIGQEAALDFWQCNAPHWDLSQYQPTQFPSDGMMVRDGLMSFPWYAQGSTDAELLDATGAIMVQMDSNSAESYLNQGSWMPG
ncbi:fungal-specific transcription factor domain-containing protein [Paraphoma chrysanthemicola]|nr:fungal-specific transcription factor domain-containing protein [Paraphoma chrysanthemicola]